MPSEQLYENQSTIINGLFDIVKGKDSTLAKIGIVNEIIGNGNSQSIPSGTYSFSANEGLSMILDNNYQSNAQATKLYDALKDGYFDQVIRDAINDSIDPETENYRYYLESMN